MDSMSTASVAALATASDRQVFGAQVVTKTLDYMNSGSMKGSGGGMSHAYEFSKDVLGAYMTGRGIIADLKV